MNSLHAQDEALKVIFSKIVDNRNKIIYARNLAKNANTIFYKELYNDKADLMEESNKVFIKGYKRQLRKYSNQLNN